MALVLMRLSEADEMRLRFMHAVDRPLEQVTVDLLCRRVGVSRQTFYNHFSSKMEIPLWYSSLCDELTLKEIGRALTWSQGLEAYFELLYRERTFLGFTVDRMETKKGERVRAADRVESHLRCLLAERGVGAIDSEMEFCLRVCSSVVVTVVSDWLDSGMALPPAEIARYTERCIPPIVHQATELR